MNARENRFSWKKMFVEIAKVVAQRSADPHTQVGAVWIDDKTGDWCTTDYYGKELQQWIKNFNTINPTYRTVSENQWEPENQYVGRYNYFLRESAPKPFKHKFSGESQYIDFKTSGLVNETVTKAALHCVSSNNSDLGLSPIMRCFLAFDSRVKRLM